MEPLKHEERRLLNKAVSLHAGGRRATLRVMNILKLYMKEPSHKLGLHDLELVRKYVNGSDAERAGQERKAAILLKSRESLTSDDHAMVARAIELSKTNPPGDKRTRHFLENYAGRRTHSASRDTLKRVKLYIERAKAPKVVAHPVKATSVGYGLETHVEVITPDKALDMLEVNEKLGFANRNIAKGRVGQYARDMKAGRWRMTGEPILIGKKGEIMNGQHRLHAIIDAETPIPMLIVRGVSSESFYSMDTGFARRSADVIGLNGQKHATLTASVLKMYYMWNTYGPNSLVSNAGQMGSATDRALGFTNEKAVELRDSTPRIMESVNIGRKFTSLCPPTAAAFTHLICSEKSKAAADEFFTKLYEGTDLKKGDPIHTLRQRLIADRAEMRGVRYLKAGYSVRIMLRMWNAWRKGERLLRVPTVVDTEPQRPV